MKCEVGVKCVICSLPLLKTTKKPRWVLNIADGSVKGVAHGTCCRQKLGYREWIDAKWGEEPPLELIKSVAFLVRKRDEFWGRGHETDENYASILISCCLDILTTRGTAELSECGESPRIKKYLEWWQRGPAQMSDDRIGRVKQLFADALKNASLITLTKCERCGKDATVKCISPVGIYWFCGDCFWGAFKELGKRGAARGA